jgi:hypothetical protein
MYHTEICFYEYIDIILSYLIKVFYFLLDLKLNKIRFN